MEPIFTTQIDYNFEAYEKYCKFVYKYIRKTGRRKIIASILLGIMIIAYVSCYFMSYNTFYLWCTLIPIVGEVVILVLIDVKCNLQIKKAWKSTQYMEDGVRITQNFYENEFEQTSEISTFHLAYDKFYAAYETPRYIYLFISNNQSVIIDKNNCTYQCLEFIKQKVSLKSVEM